MKRTEDAAADWDDPGALRRSAEAGGDAVRVQRFSVPFEYRVHFTEDALDPANEAVVEAVAREDTASRHRVWAVIDEGVAKLWPGLPERLTAYVEHHGDRLELAAQPDVVAGGEQVKNDATLVDRVHERVRALGIDRKSYVLVIGGGALQDAVGFAAATAHRGVRLVRMPTTVLSQNDSGVGVKNGLNAFGTKNFVGTFAPPYAVINDRRFLDTLPARDRAAGMAEAVKVALIRDADFFDWLEAHADALAAFAPDEVAVSVRRSAELHMRHIATSGDPFELGTAKPLDFGHWVAHRLETMSGHELRHGEAVAVGVAVDCTYSVERGLLDELARKRVCNLLERLGLPPWDDTLAARDEGGRLQVLSGLDEFREHLGGELSVTLLEAIGRGVDANAMDEAFVERSIAWLARHHRRPR